MVDVEIQLKTRLKEIEEKIRLGLLINEASERRRRKEIQHFETPEKIQHKRRILQSLENELRNKSRKHAKAHARLEQETDLTRVEYYTLKDKLDKSTYTLRFSIEEELKIYQALLNSLDQQKHMCPSTNESTSFQLSKTSVLRTNRY